MNAKIPQIDACILRDFVVLEIHRKVCYNFTGVTTGFVDQPTAPGQFQGIQTSKKTAAA